MCDCAFKNHPGFSCGSQQCHCHDTEKTIDLRNVRSELIDIREKLDQTLDSIDYNSGPVRDTMRLVIPMMRDHNTALLQLLEALDRHIQKLEHLPGKE